MPKDAMMAIAEVGNRPEGFTGSNAARILNDRLDITVGEAVRSLRIAEYLYHRVADLGLEVTEAVRQLDAISSKMDAPVHLDDERKGAITAVLAFKRDYEVTTATRESITNGPHLAGINGSWNVKLAKISNGEVINIPVMTLRIVCHDGSNNIHEIFLQISDRSWRRLINEIKALDESRKDVENLL